jgi:predicted Zn-dependent protease
MAMNKKGHQWCIILAAFFLFNGVGEAILGFHSSIAHATLTVEKEKEMGRRIVLQIEKQLEVIRDPSVKGYVESIGDRIVPQIGRTPYEFRYYVVRSPDPNAFAIPGGYIFLASGLVLMSSSEDEVAGVVGHEIAHIKARHIAQRIERSKKLNLMSIAGLLAAVIMGGKAGGAVAAGSVATSSALALKYSREDEREADQLGLQYVTKAGYDGWGLVSFLKKMSQKTLHTRGTPPSYLLTHPGSDDRITYLMERLRDSPPKTSKGKGKGLKRIQTTLFVEERAAQTAVIHFQSTLKGNPTDVDALYGLGLAYKKMGRIDLAIGKFERARQASPKDGDILRELGICYFSRRRLEDALSVLRESLAVRGGDILALYYMGRAYQEKGNLDASLDAYLKAKAINPGMVDLYYSLAMVYGKMGDSCKSHRNFSTYFRKKGEAKYALVHLRKALQYCGEKAEIQKEIRKLEGTLKKEETEKR